MGNSSLLIFYAHVRDQLRREQAGAAENIVRFRASHFYFLLQSVFPDLTGMQPPGYSLYCPVDSVFELKKKEKLSVLNLNSFLSYIAL